MEGKKAIGLEVDGKVVQGFHTLSKKAEYFSSWLADWKWPEYAIPIYPKTKEERQKMVHVVTQVHHDFMEKRMSLPLTRSLDCPITSIPVQSTPNI